MENWDLVSVKSTGFWFPSNFELLAKNRYFKIRLLVSSLLASSFRLPISGGILPFSFQKVSGEKSRPIFQNSRSKFDDLCSFYLSSLNLPRLLLKIC